MLRTLSTREKWYLAAHAVFFVLFITPFVIHSVIPLSDYPNHLARAYIINDPALFTGVYDIKFDIAPYFADMLPQLFIGTFGIYLAGKINFVIGLLTIAIGVLLINRHVCGRITLPTFFIYIFLYNLATAYGFVNYNLAMGIALISIWGWLRFPKFTHNWLVVTVFLTANFMLHAVSYGIMTLLLFIYELWPVAVRDPVWRKRFIFLLTAVIPQFIILLIAPHEALQDGNEFGDALSKIQSLFSPALFSYTLPDLLIVPAFLALFFAGVLRIQPRFWPVVIITLALSFLVPHKFLGISLLSIRIPIFLTLFICAVSTWHFQRRLKRHEILLAGFLLIVCFRHHENLRGLSECGTMYDEYLSALRSSDMEPHYAIQTYAPDHFTCPLPSSFGHANALAVIEKRIFVPTLFTLMPPVRTAEDFSQISLGVGKPRDDSELMADSDPHMNDYKYILWLHKKAPLEITSPHLDLLQQGSFFSIYKNTTYRNHKEAATP